MARFTFSLFLFAILIAGIGCASSNRLSTPSGKPEVFIRHVGKEKARAVLVQMLSNEGMHVANETPSTLTLLKKREGGFWTYRKEEYTFIFWSHEDGTKVFANGRYAYDPDERKYPPQDMENESDLNRLQNILNRLKTRLKK